MHRDNVSNLDVRNLVLHSNASFEQTQQEHDTYTPFHRSTVRFHAADHPESGCIANAARRIIAEEAECSKLERPHGLAS